MPIAALRPIRAGLARIIWPAIADDVVSIAVDLVRDGIDRDEAIDFGIGLGLEALEAAAPAIVDAAARLGERIDDRLEWKWVRSAKRKEWLEAHDDLSPFLRALARRAIAGALEAGRSTAPLR